MTEPLRRSERIRRSRTLTETQRQQLQVIFDAVEDQTERFGDDSKEAHQKPCRRLKSNANWTKKKNKITPNPRWLKLFHVAWMLENNIVMPPHCEGEISHICLDPNRNGVNRRQTGARCFEGSHLEFCSHAHNKSRDPCHDLIDKWVANNRSNPKVRTTGIICISDLANHFPISWECIHIPLCFGCYGKISV